jgi:hypothetical protein
MAKSNRRLSEAERAERRREDRERLPVATEELLSSEGLAAMGPRPRGVPLLLPAYLERWLSASVTRWVRSSVKCRRGPAP